MRNLSTEEMVAVSGGGLGSWLRDRKAAVVSIATTVAVAGGILVSTGVGAPVGIALLTVGAVVGVTAVSV